MSKTIAGAQRTEVRDPVAFVQHNLGLLRNARAAKIVVLSDAGLKAAGSSIDLFVEALGLPHMLATVERHSCHVVGVHTTGEQIAEAVAYFDGQEQAQAGATLKTFRKNWRRAHNEHQPYAAGMFMFVLNGLGLTVDDLRKRMIPSPEFVQVVPYRHPSGLHDEMVLVASTADLLAGLVFRVTLTDVEQVHATFGEVVDVADPENRGRVRLRLRYVTEPDADPAGFPWVPRAPGVTDLAIPALGSTVVAELRINEEGAYNVSYHPRT